MAPVCRETQVLEFRRAKFPSPPSARHDSARDRPFSSESAHAQPAGHDGLEVLIASGMSPDRRRASRTPRRSHAALPIAIFRRKNAGERCGARWLAAGDGGSDCGGDAGAPDGTSGDDLEAVVDAMVVAMQRLTVEHEWLLRTIIHETVLHQGSAEVRRRGRASDGSKWR